MAPVVVITALVVVVTVDVLSGLFTTHAVRNVIMQIVVPLHDCDIDFVVEADVDCWAGRILLKLE